MTTLETVLLITGLALIAAGATAFFAFGQALGFIGITIGVIALCAVGFFRGKK